jgi:glycosyltransferase involved in cell wall biosynthesis
LIESIHNQTYPSELIKIFVVADNCTDHTASVARAAGAVVWERFNRLKIGKGYAIDFLLDRIGKAYPERSFDGYFVFDADNLLDENYVWQMNHIVSLPAIVIPRTMEPIGYQRGFLCGFCGNLNI